ncbi:MAG: hydrogenase formation protein HypD [Candidatus Omnitrophota bacterium]
MIKHLDEYRDTGLCMELAESIRRISSRPFRIMEVCGGHTMAVRKNGIHKMVGDNIELISGPGCPVCVTSVRDIDKIIAVSGIEGVAVCTFGDMVYVPGSRTSLAGARSSGADVRTVYSAHDVLDFAKEEPDKDFVFVSVGFETTTPTTAAAIAQAEREGISNFSALAFNKTMPNALGAVLRDENSRIEALICPGHVSTITGIGMYRPIVEELGVSCCITGFEPVDILGAIYKLAELREKGETALINAYERAVREEGNIKAQGIMGEVFEPAPVEWRGFGVIPSSGLKIRDKYRAFDAEKIYDVNVPEPAETEGCSCADMLRGAKKPADCKLFRKVCTPENPMGACMVSSEGTCAAWFRYGA